MQFSDKVSIGLGFKRSINLQQDQADKDVLEHYICPPSSEQVLQSMCQHITANQSAFTWTGPYGSGKSSLAVFLSALTSGNQELYDIVADKLNLYKEDILNKFNLLQQRKIIAVVGSPDNPINILANVLGVKASAQHILDALEKHASNGAGVILFIDEMGKFLEKATIDGTGDVYLFQQIAELANRSDGKIIFIGILHQSFAEYSRNLSKTLRDEWSKIQGRFVDLAINAAGEEQINLIARAIISNEKPQAVSSAVCATSQLIAQNRPVAEDLLSQTLNACWPLHPVVASLLGPVSRKQFGQNQRSIFSFLSSAEPFGFQFFLKQTEFDKGAIYSPHLYWDYLRANFEGSILASSDAKIWIVAVEAINKCAVSSTNDEAQNVMKTIALIDIFKSTSGLLATSNILQSIFSHLDITDILAELEKLSLIRQNKFSNSYPLFEGSDFNIDEALDEAYKQIPEIDFQKLNQLASFKPIIAKRHYHETGAMRWMDVKLLPADLLNNHVGEADTNAFGEFLIIIPRDNNEFIEIENALSHYKIDDVKFPRILGVAKKYKRLLSLSEELLAIEWLRKNSPMLAGDKIARREVENRYALISNLLHVLFEKTLNEIIWTRNGERVGQLTARATSSYVSDLANMVFTAAPLLKSEMINRNKPSGNANAALNILLKKMVLNEGEKRLGIEGYPAEGGIFKILLEDTQLYRKIGKQWQFSVPTNGDANLLPLWKHTDNLLTDKDANITVKHIYAEWEKPPFGIKKGLHTFLMTVYLLANKEHVAVYLDGTYVPEITDLLIDYLVRNSVEISLRHVSNNIATQPVLKQIIGYLSDETSLNLYLAPNASPLEVARKLVGLADNLNPWVLRTRTVSKQTIALRDILKSAHDPNKLIFDDLPELFDFHKETTSATLSFSASLNELIDAYPSLLERLGSAIMKELEVGLVNDTAIARLRERAKNILKSSGDFRTDALIARLATFNQTQEDIAGIAALAANKPIHDWIDIDVERALIEISDLCKGFKKAELYARVAGKRPQRHAIALISGLSGTDKIYQSSFDVLTDNQPKIDAIKARMKELLQAEDNPEFVLAAIAELSAEYMDMVETDNTQNNKVINQ